MSYNIYKRTHVLFSKTSYLGKHGSIRQNVFFFTTVPKSLIEQIDASVPRERWLFLWTYDKKEPSITCRGLILPQADYDTERRDHRENSTKLQIIKGTQRNTVQYRLPIPKWIFRVMDVEEFFQTEEGKQLFFQWVRTTEGLKGILSFSEEAKESIPEIQYEKSLLLSGENFNDVEEKMQVR